MVWLEKNDIYATLTTWLYCNFWMKWALEQQGKRTYINWPKGKFLIDLEDKKKFNECENAYEWYFKQEKDYIIPEYKLTWEQWIDHSPIPFMAMPLKVIKEYYQRNLKFNDETDRRGQLLVDKYKIDFSNTIGITWRGTDAKTDGRVRLPIDVYFRFIDDILKDNPTVRIMCTAEEESILDPLLARYPQAFKIEEFYQAPHGGKQNPERFSPLSGYERGLQPVLMVWLFSKCAWYIKNRSSTGAVASWLSNGRIVNIAHEETLSYLKMDDQVEIEGIKYPL